MNAAEDDGGAGGTRRAPDFVSPQRIARVDANPHHVTGTQDTRIEQFERLVDDDRRAESFGRRGREDEEPSRRDDGNPEGHVTGID